MTAVAQPRVVNAGAALIVGGGIAGLTTALSFPHPCTLVLSRELGAWTATALAQGGIAAATTDDDSPAAHAADTLVAGAGLCDPVAVNVLTREAPAAIDWLEAHGVVFDVDANGERLRGLEGAHSVKRILHCNGDGTGAAIEAALVEAVRQAKHVTVWENTYVDELAVADGRVVGAHARTVDESVTFLASEVVLATGGYAALLAHTSNPSGSWGSGLALAAHAGAELRDLEMVQFHPTALAVEADPMPLVTEAVRGAGAQLVSADGRPLVADPLAGRDIVARAVADAYRRGEKVFLNTPETLGAKIEERFPGVTTACRAAGIDPTRDPIPVRPAAHYTMGGITVDLYGNSTVPGLRAVGECSSTGVHGANRLASNSLLEAVVFGRRVGGSLGATKTYNGPVSTPTIREGAPKRERREQVENALGIVRVPGEIESLLTTLLPTIESSNGDLVAVLLAASALRRHESRGAHRWDGPARVDDVARHTTITLADVRQLLDDNEGIAS